MINNIYKLLDERSKLCEYAEELMSEMIKYVPGTNTKGVKLLKDYWDWQEQLRESTKASNVKTVKRRPSWVLPDQEAKNNEI